MRLCDLPGIRRLGFCHGGHHHANKLNPMTEYLVMITRVALGVMAAMTSLTLFVPAFAGGMGIGLYHRLYSNDHHHHDDPFSIAGCGQFMQTMAGMDFPPELSLFANMAITVCHLDHHPFVFVPYCAMAMGMWAGQLTHKPLTNTINWFKGCYV